MSLQSLRAEYTLTRSPLISSSWWPSGLCARPENFCLWKAQVRIFSNSNAQNRSFYSLHPFLLMICIFIEPVDQRDTIKNVYENRDKSVQSKTHADNVSNEQNFCRRKPSKRSNVQSKI